MPPRKRKAAAASPAITDDVTAFDTKLLQATNERLRAIDAAVEERCEAIMAAAEEAADNLMQELKAKLLGLPKKVRTMKHNDYAETNPQLAADAAAAAVDSKLAHAQQQSESLATAAPSTRSTRSRARAGAAEPATVRVTRARQPVPKFAAPEVPASSALIAVESAGSDGGVASGKSTAAPAEAVFGVHLPSSAAEAGTPPAAAQQSAASGPATVTTQPADTAPDARHAGVKDRAQARVDARLAAIGVAASTAARAGGRTAQRTAQPGEQAYSRNGSPLSLHPNITRARGRTAGGWGLMTPAMQAAAQGAAGPNGSMVGCFTLVKKLAGAAGTAAATGRAGRSRAATAAGRATAAAGDGQETAMIIMTDDGSSFAVEASAGGLAAVPEAYRDEVAAKLRAIQQLAARALGGA